VAAEAFFPGGRVCALGKNVFALSERLIHSTLREGEKRLPPPPFAERGDTSPTLPPCPTIIYTRARAMFGIEASGDRGVERRREE